MHGDRKPLGWQDFPCIDSQVSTARALDKDATVRAAVRMASLTSFFIG